jgi:tripartite-type tricarboxylate transporter receptor subunit TctC
MVHVPYKGEAQAALDLTPGRVQAMLITPAMAKTFGKDSDVRPLAVLLPERSELMRDVPTLVESGQPPLDIALWGGIVGPPGLPADLVQRWNGEFRKVIDNPDIRSQLDQLGMPLQWSRADEFAVFLRTQKDTWGRTMRDANIQVD